MTDGVPTLEIRRANGFLFESGQKLAYLVAAADLVVKHGSQQRSQMYPQRHGNNRSWMVIQRLDEIIEFIHALFQRGCCGSSEAIRHDGSPIDLYAHDNATRSRKQPSTGIFEPDLLRKPPEMAATKALADGAQFLYERASLLRMPMRSCSLDSFRLVNRALPNFKRGMSNEQFSGDRDR
jgi:hypothetical protein